jgi:hypothetical protein
MTLIQVLLKNDHGSQCSVRCQTQVKVTQLVVVSHQPRPEHVDPLRAYGVGRLRIAERNRDRAGLWAPAATQKKCLVGLEQGETKGTEVDDLQSTF